MRFHYTKAYSALIINSNILIYNKDAIPDSLRFGLVVFFLFDREESTSEKKYRFSFFIDKKSSRR